MKICLMGSSTYENRRKIKDTIFQLKNMFKEDLHILGGGGNDGANKYVKKYTLEFDIKYTEYNPAYTNYNLYSALSEGYYGKKYHATHIHHRNDMIAKVCDKMILFIPNNQSTNGYTSAYKKMKRLKKDIVIMI